MTYIFNHSIHIYLNYNRCFLIPQSCLPHSFTGCTKAIQIIHFWRFCLSATFCAFACIPFFFCFLQHAAILAACFCQCRPLILMVQRLRQPARPETHFVLCFRRVARCADGQQHLQAAIKRDPLCAAGAASTLASTWIWMYK